MAETEKEPLVKQSHHDDDDDAEKGCCARCCAGCLPSRYLKVSEFGKMQEYDHESNLSWQALLMTTGTIFFHKSVSRLVPYIILLILTSALLVYFGVPHAQRLNTSKFNDFVTYIRVFIAFMLGLFLATSFSRWWSSVAAFKHFLTSIKQLMYTLHAIGVKDDLFNQIKRLAITSAFVLNTEVHMEQLDTDEKKNQVYEQESSHLLVRGFITPVEKEELDKYNQQILGTHSTMIWTWIGEAMTRVRMEETKNGTKPPPPMYVRLLFLCHDCMGQVESLKTNLTVQIPFTYAHMLAWMIHLANVLLAISCGLAIGSAMDEIVSRSEQMGQSRRVPSTIVKNLYEAIQVVGMQLLIGIIQPLIYQSFLVIAHCLCYPFGNHVTHMPTETFIQQMMVELDVMESSKNHVHAAARRRASQSQGDLDIEKNVGKYVKKKTQEKQEDEEDGDDDAD